MKIYDNYGKEHLPKFKVGDVMRWRNTGQAARILEVSIEIGIPTCSECEHQGDLTLDDVFRFVYSGKFWKNSDHVGVMREQELVPFDTPWDEHYWGKKSDDSDRVNE